MSRIEEALRRAQAGTTEGEPQPPLAGGPVVPGSVPAADVFRDAWTVDGDGEVTAPADAPADARVDAPTVQPEPPLFSAAAPEPKTTASAAEPGTSAAHPPTTAMAVFHGFNPTLTEKIVATTSIRPAFVEQYRKLASTLHHAQIERSLKVVMVTSALASEGKSLTATNLALTLSESYQRSVLLIDADLRRPSLHDTFQVPNVVGLGDGLRSDKDQKLSLVQVSSNLTLLTAGRPDPDPISGLTSDRMKRVIEEASARFDWVIVDTPPVGLLPDANLLAGMVDAAILVIAAGTTPYPLIQRAVAALGRDRILGVVLNRAEEGIAGSYSYYSYYDSYGKKAAS